MAAGTQEKPGVRLRPMYIVMSRRAGLCGERGTRRDLGQGRERYPSLLK